MCLPPSVQSIDATVGSLGVLFLLCRVVVSQITPALFLLLSSFSVRLCFLAFPPTYILHLFLSALPHTKDPSLEEMKIAKRNWRSRAMDRNKVEKDC